MTNNAFHGDPEFKRQLVEAAIEHRKQDDYIAGAYAKCSEETGRFRGCSVGCSLYDVQKIRGIEVYNHGNHALLADTLGVPEWLCFLQDAIFEGLPDQERSRWTERLYAAIPVGADLDPVKHHIAIRRLTRLADAQRLALESATNEHGVADAIKAVLDVLERVITCHRAETGEIGCVADWPEARSAAYSATLFASWAAAWEVALEDSAARSAAWAARSAARPDAESAARAAGLAELAEWSAAWQQEADALLEVLSGMGEGG